MNHQQFIESWNQVSSSALIKFPLELIEKIPIPSNSIFFLTTVGLPESAAPFLSFSYSNEFCLPLVSEYFNLGEKIEGYRVIGSNAYGDPVVIEEISGYIFELNHEWNFNKTYINSSLETLAQCLLFYTNLINEGNKRNGEEGYWDDDLPNDSLEQFFKKVTAIDSNALEHGAMWYSTTRY